ncbi:MULTISPECIES: hypothetical protein [unclassified Streptomyces]|uniref:hypothetical protein n=1 Tax=unclassified Streptomyces TaxID=2593676 RepID=UPI001F210BE8|nr:MULTISPECIES: hypothetical protein [unclassified Streptomyces]
MSLARGGLVTDVFERQAPTGRRNHRFRPIHSQQLEALAHPYKAVLPAEQASAESPLNVAQQAGAPVPRALLDAGAHRSLAAGAGWGQARKAAMPAQAGLRTPQPQVRVRRRAL